MCRRPLLGGERLGHACDFVLGLDQGITRRVQLGSESFGVGLGVGGFFRPAPFRCSRCVFHAIPDTVPL